MVNLPNTAALEQAAASSTPPARLGWLARRCSTLARVVASNPAATPGLLGRLAHSEDRVTREAVCRNPRAPVRIAYLLAEEMPEVFAASARGQALFHTAAGRVVEYPRAPTLRRLLHGAPLAASWIDAALAHPYPSARWTLATAPGLAPAVLARLVQDSSSRVRRTVAQLGQLQPLLLQQLAGDLDPSVRGVVAGRQGLPADLLAGLAVDPSPQVRAEVAENPELPVPLLLALAEEDEPLVNMRLVCNPQAPPEALARVAQRLDALDPVWVRWEGRRRLVSHPHTAEPVVARLLQEASPEHRASLTFDAHNLSVATMLALANDPCERVARALCYRHDLPEEVLWRLFALPSSLCRAGAACHPQAPEALLARAGADPSGGVRQALAENLSPTAQIWQPILARDPNFDVRRTVASRTTSQELLLLLSRDSEATVRCAVVYNRATPTELAARLRRDPGVISVMNPF